jgi:anthranilate synthase
MAVEHQHLPLAAVQFHPESILTRPGDLGLQLVDNAVALLVDGFTA